MISCIQQERLCIHDPLPQKTEEMASFLDMSNSLSIHFPQTSTSVTRLRQPPHSASMRAVSTLMVPSAVFAVPDLHPRTSHITVFLLDPGPEQLRAPSLPLVCMCVRMSDSLDVGWTDTEECLLWHQFIMPSPSHQCPGPVLGSLTHFLPFYTIFN